MARFRRKDFEVTAERVAEDTTVPTFRGSRTAHPGDWVLRTHAGDCWVMTDIVFRAVYDPIDDEAKEMMRNG